MRKRRSIVWSIPKEKLLELVETSNSIKELVGKVGLNNKSGSNDMTVKECLEYHGIDWKPLALKGIKNKGQDFNNLKVPASELFSSNSKHGRSVVRKRVIQENLIPYKCAICGQEPEWNGKPMPVENGRKAKQMDFVPLCVSPAAERLLAMKILLQLHALSAEIRWS